MSQNLYQLPATYRRAEMLNLASSLNVQAIAAPVLVLVPHADDETLGCGGLLASLYEVQIPTDVLLVTDGTQSHPNCKTYQKEQRQQKREEELIAAIQALGGSEDRVLFWRKPDTAVPDVDSPFGKTAVTELLHYLTTGGYKTVLTPYRNDPHGDHKATTQLLLAASIQVAEPLQILEYFVWLGHQDSQALWPELAQAKLYKLKLDDNLIERKRKALQSHQSQLGNVFGGQGGFTIPASLAATVNDPYELYLDANSQA